MNDLTKEVVITALRHMFEKGWLDICTIDKCLKLTGAIPDKRDYEILSALHCIHWSEMSQGLRQEVYDKTIAMISGTGFDLSSLTMVFNKQKNAYELKQPKKRFRLLGG